MTTEFGAVVSHSGNLWNKFRTHDAAQRFCDEAPAPMHVVCRQTNEDTHTPWARILSPADLRLPEAPGMEHAHEHDERL
jgi:hypothetical protein